jgi:hypothetical protein
MNKIDLIVDALEDICGGRCNAEYNPCQARVALTAARELKAFREVLVGDNYILRFHPSDTGWMCGISNEMMDAIEEVTK